MVTSKQHELLERFQAIKHGFSGDLDEKYSLLLPGSLGRDKNPRRGPVSGQVQITGYGIHLATFAVTLTWLNISKDLADMFEESVAGTKALLLQQLALVQLKGLRAQVRHVILLFGNDVADLCLQSVFLSGGFSKSPYLGKLIENLCDLHGIALQRAWDR